MENNDLPDRLAILEMKVESKVAELYAVTRHMSNAIDKIERHLADFASQMAQLGRTDWKLVLTGLGTILAIMGIYTSAVLKPYQLQVDYLSKEIHEQEQKILKLEGR